MGFYGVSISGGAGTVVNNGRISGVLYDRLGVINFGAGVYLGSGGSVTNGASADITGGYGVKISGGAGTVINDGRIAGTEPPDGISSDGVYLASGGSVTNVAVGADVAVVCFLSGTHILTESGEIKVEDLVIGQRVITHSGEAKPIKWIGVGKVLATRGKRSAATAVIVRKGALGLNVPTQDLRVTKGHALYIDGVRSRSST
jgi:hypothetical protein